jgi:DNA-binding transcriptional regulator YhcF (GntR family)
VFKKLAGTFRLLYRSEMASDMQNLLNKPVDKVQESSESPLVIEVLQKICDELRDQKYQIGDKLPTFRDWSEKYQVSLYAARKALLHLKNTGIISAREGSYTFLVRKPEVEGSSSTIEKGKTRARIHVCLREAKDFRKLQISLLHKQFRNRYMASHPEREVKLEFVQTSLFLKNTHDWQDHTGASFGDFTATHLDFLTENQLIWPMASAELAAPVREEFERYCARLLPKVREASLCASGDSSRGPSYGLLPEGISVPLLTRFKPILLECGLPVDKAPADWGEFYDFCLRIKKKLNLVPLHFSDYSSLIWWYFHLEAQAAPVRPNQSTEAIFRPGASGLQAIEFLCKLGSEGLLAVHQEGVTGFHSQCLSGKIPMFVSTHDSPSRFFYLGDAEPFALSQLPSGPNRRITGLFNVCGQAIRAGLPAEDNNAIVDYLLSWKSFLHSKSKEKSIKRMGIVPSILQPWADDTVAKEIPHSWQRALLEALGNSLPEPQNSDLQKQSLQPFFQDHFRLSNTMQSPEELLHSICLHLSEDGLW